MSTTAATLANMTTTVLVTASHMMGEIMENVTHGLEHPDHHQDDRHDDGDGHDHHAVSYIPWHNPDNVLTVEQRELSLTIIDCGFIPPIVLFGLIGNIITLIVFYRQGFKERTNICLIALAVSDTMFLLTTYMEKAACLVTRIDEVIGKNWAALLRPQGYFISLYFGRVTSVITMVIALERCIAVLRPLQAKTWLTTSRMRQCVVCVYILVAILIAPMFCVYKTHSEVDTISNSTRISLVTTKLFDDNHRAFECYGDVALSIVLRLIPCYMVALSTIVVICTLRRQRSWRSETGKGNKDMSAQDQKITKMLVVISALYVFCLTPGTIIMIVRHVITDIHVGRKMHNLAIVLTAANVLTEIINSSFNFAIYMVMSRKFSSTLRKMLGCEESKPKLTSTDDSMSKTGLSTKISAISTD